MQNIRSRRHVTGFFPLLFLLVFVETKQGVGFRFWVLTIRGFWARVWSGGAFLIITKFLNFGAAEVAILSVNMNRSVLLL